jgi:hypothetical protein
MNKVVIVFLATIFCMSCVQKTHKRKVTFILDVSKVKNVQSAGIRGEGKPLSWDTDFPMKELVKDSLYEAVVEGETGYKWTDVKFTVNGEFEFQDQPNREVVFTGEETVYKAVFDKR